MKRFGFARVAAAVPKLKLADPEENVSEILAQLEALRNSGRPVLTVFPELCLTGYTAADLFQQRVLLEAAQKALLALCVKTAKHPDAFIVGLPLAADGKIFNAAAVIAGGRIHGIVPKTYIPGYKEFYEERWFASGRDLKRNSVRIGDQNIPFGTDLLFRFAGVPDLTFGVEICEDVWTPLPPSSFMAVAGATVIANLSASNELVGKAGYRRELIGQQSARAVCGYIYSSSGVHESTTDIVFGGHAMIAENGYLLAESKRFDRAGEWVMADIDLEHLRIDRERTTSFGESVHESGGRIFRTVELPEPAMGFQPALIRRLDPNPFVPADNAERSNRCNEIFSIQAAGLAKRLEMVQRKNLLIGLSGGLDSTLAILVAAKTADLLKMKREEILAITMPGFATTGRTKSNAGKLARALGVSLETVDITDSAKQHLKDIGHDGKTQDVTFQNVQARYRTTVLFNRANQSGGIVVGTGDLSEIALGWCTYNGDHISHYNVNASVPKTLVRYLVQWASEQPEFAAAKKVLQDILDTPISPELVIEKKNQISQKTEDLIGPYELHDFFLYHFLRWGSAPSKIVFLAEIAFGRKYDEKTIRKWLRLFLKRFFAAQWKRSVATDGPKVGSVSLSPRGDWRMPSDAEAKLWLKELGDE